MVEGHCRIELLILWWLGMRDRGMEGSGGGGYIIKYVCVLKFKPSGTLTLLTGSSIPHANLWDTFPIETITPIKIIGGILFIFFRCTWTQWKQEHQ